MTQIEIAKKILKQNNCYGIRCGTCQLDENNYKCNSNGYRLTDRDRKELEQWLKEQEKEMIDLNVNQIVNPPVKCWVRDYTNVEHCERLLYAIVNNRYITSQANEKDTELISWKYCSLTDPSKPKFKTWLTVEDVPPGLWGNAWYKAVEDEDHDANILTPYAITGNKNEIYKEYVWIPISQNPIGAKWRKMESEVIE